MRLPRDKDVLENARALRKSMTREERHLWYDFLRGYSPRFVRQKVVGRYILDFYCDAAGLAIELDGSQHYEAAGQLHDAQRTEYLEGFGIRVLRFSNLDVMQHFDAVHGGIKEAGHHAEDHGVDDEAQKEDQAGQQEAIGSEGLAPYQRTAAFGLFHCRLCSQEDHQTFRLRVFFP